MRLNNASFEVSMFWFSSIALEVKDISPDTKYFLIKLLYCYERKPIEAGVKGVSAALGLSDRVVSRGFRFLCEKNILSQECISQGRGRPGSRYTFHPSLLSKLEAEGQSASHGYHKELIKSILLHDYSSKADEKPHPLNATSRLVLSVLLFHATESGVVLNLGTLKIAKVTGMKIPALMKQIKQLVKLGYIRQYVSGFTNRNLFGRAKGIYFMHLRHPNYKSVVIDGSIFLYRSPFVQLYSNQNEAAYLFQAVKTSLSKLSDQHGLKLPYRAYTPDSGASFDMLELVTGIEEFFQHKSGIGLRDYFQIMIEYVASDFMTNDWDKLIRDSPDNSPSTRQIELVHRLFIQSTYPETIDERFPSQDQITQFEMLIFRLAMNIAFSIKTFLMKSEPTLPYSRMAFRILPVSKLWGAKYGAGSFAVESFYKQSSSKNRRYRKPYCFEWSAKDPSSSGRSTQRFEEEFGEQELLNWGLRS